jgi:hypothetical protein
MRHRNQNSTIAMTIRTCLPFLLSAVLVRWTAPAAADDFEQPPISYSQTTPNNPVSALQTRWDAGAEPPQHEPHFGYLREVLGGLGIPESSQGLVFSKTSLQRHRIAPRTPRALYFNDDVYVGFCQQGEVLEVSAADPQLGTVFYTLDQRQADRPRFVRQADNCLLCHASTQTQDVPGHLIRSVFVDAGGNPILSSGSYRTDHTSPFEERWGGWYVTGTHGGQRHLGNMVVREREVVRPVENAQGQNVTDLSGRITTDRYLTPHSDLVALMVLDHQAMAHNRIARASFLTRQALHYETELNRELNMPPDHRWESAAKRIKSACDPLVECLLFSGEAPLTAPIAGTSTFAADFARAAHRDPQGRSLRDFDLQTRLFRYPCSYLIYSDSFRALPAEAKDYVWRRMKSILESADPDPKYAHLSPADRAAILEILKATLPEWPGDQPLQ